MKRLFSFLVGISLLASSLISPLQSQAQALPTLPAHILGDLKGYTTSYISGGPHGGQMLIVGGVKGGVHQNMAMLFDPATGTLETPEVGSLRLGAPRAYHTATSLADGRILLFGGESAPAGYLEVAEIFDPQTFSFSPVSVSGKDLPHLQRKRHAASFFYRLGQPDQYVLISGGCTGACSSADNLRASILYNVDKETFLPGPLMQTARRDHTATYLPAAQDSGVVMIQGGGTTQPEYFDIASFQDTAGTGQFIQNGRALELVQENQVLLKNDTPAQNVAPVFENVPAAVTNLLNPPAEEAKPTQNAEVLRKQLEELERLQASINNLRIATGGSRVVASDSRGRVMVSGGTVTTPAASQVTGTGAAMGDSVGRALIAQQQEKLSRMLSGRGGVGTGSLLAGTTEEQYAANFSLFLTSQNEDTAALLQQLSIYGRDSDGDGLSDQVELSASLDPFTYDTDKDGTDDLETFIGLSSSGAPVWGARPPVSSLCETDGTLWGRTNPGEEVGIFQQTTGSGARLQIAKTTADKHGGFVSPLSLPASGGNFTLVVRIQDTIRGFLYSEPRSFTFVSCTPDAAVMLDRVTVRGATRVVEGRALPGSHVFLALPDSWVVTMADPQGGFVAPLPALLPAGKTTLRTWSVLGGQSSTLRSYPLEIPLQPAGSGSVLGEMRPAAEDAMGDSPLFWWIYGIAIAGGVATLSALALELRRRYAQGDTTPDFDTYG